MGPLVKNWKCFYLSCNPSRQFEISTWFGVSLFTLAFLCCLQVPSYISRSVAGSYDNEAVAIFALIFTFYLYIKVKWLSNFVASVEGIMMAYSFHLFIMFTVCFLDMIKLSFHGTNMRHWLQTLNTGSLFYATLNAIAYFYMVGLSMQMLSYLWFELLYCILSSWHVLCIFFQVCSWGGYTFIINLIPMHVLLCIVTGRYSSRLYIAYAPLVSIWICSYFQTVY